MKKSCLFCLVLLLLLTACTHRETDPRGGNMETYDIVANGVLTYEETLRIGAANFWPEEYVDADGVTRRGMTALLSIWREDNLDAPQDVRVHVGQVIEFDGYKIEVVDIGRDGGTYFVAVAISSNGTTP